MKTYTKRSTQAGEWRTSRLAEVGVVLIDCVHETPPTTDDGLPYVTIPDMRGGRLDLDGARRISQADFVEWTRKAAPSAHDVVLSRRCNPGETAYVPPGAQFALGQNLVLLRADGTCVYPPFLRWLVRGPEWWEQIQTFLNVGAVFDSLKCADVPEFELAIPPMEVQRPIAHTLSSLDDKIELNRRMNRTLEQMAAAIFKAWFVDFEPVKAKAAGAKRFPSMPQPVFDTLPTTFTDSPIGPIPKGWRCAPLPELIEVNPTRSLRKGEAAPYLDMANMPTSGHAPDTWIDRPFGSGMRFSNGDTLVARITPCLENGKTAFVDFLSDGQIGWGSTEYIVLRPKPPLPPLFAYCLARSEDFRAFAIQRMTGSSGRQRVPADCLSQFLLPAPLSSLAAAFGSFVGPLFSQARLNMDQMRTLAAIRDALLPKLLSGELRVRDAELLKG